MLTHHAYFYEGDTALLETLALRARQMQKFPANDPDVYVRSYEKFGIPESRELQDRAALKPAAGRALFIISAATMTTEAQQALLKLLEEPQQGAVFVLLVPHGALLSTLRSRCLPFPERLEDKGAGKKGGSIESKEIKQFLVASYKERTEYIAKLLKDDEDVRHRVREFLNALEQDLFGHLSAASEAARKEIADSLGEVALMRDYLSDRSPSLKMLLEHLAAFLPKIS